MDRISTTCLAWEHSSTSEFVSNRRGCQQQPARVLISGILALYGETAADTAGKRLSSGRPGDDFTASFRQRLASGEQGF